MWQWLRVKTFGSVKTHFTLSGMVCVIFFYISIWEFKITGTILHREPQHNDFYLNIMLVVDILYLVRCHCFIESTDATAQWIRLRLPSCGPRFESLFQFESELWCEKNKKGPCLENTGALFHQRGYMWTTGINNFWCSLSRLVPDINRSLRRDFRTQDSQ